MLDAMNESEPVSLKPGQWHIPFRKHMVDLEEQVLNDFFQHPNKGFVEKCIVFGREFNITAEIVALLKISTMMSARTSYTVPNAELSEWTVEKYCDKHDELQTKKHWSPFEHCAQCPTEEQYHSRYSGSIRSGITGVGVVQFNEFKQLDDEGFGWWGNFHGFKQYRKFFAEENSKDSRLLKKQYIQPVNP
jgi:hypothetical protein